MAIYRGSGGAGDATGDATNASVLAVAAAAEAQASATSAASSATNAASSASAAASSETDAGNSATAAATSATDAAASASTASTQATNASNSATAAASSASAASSSASSASSSASAASTSATNAASSASSASTSATNASNSASAAATSATNAANSASDAADSAALAATFDPALYLTKANPSFTGTLTGTGDIRLNNGTADGAQLQLASSGYSDWNLDNYSGNLRAYYGSTEYFSLSNTGTLTVPTLAVTNTVTTANNLGLNPYGNGFKNRIINGAMVIDQRNAGANVSLSSTPQFVTDRFVVRTGTGSGHTAARSTDAPAGFKNSLAVTIGTGGTPASTDGFNYLQQVIEGFNAADLGFGTVGAATVTISFWVKSSLTGQFGASFCNYALNRTYPFTYTINASNTWEQKTVTVAGDTTGTWSTDNSGWGGILFDLGNGANYLGTPNSWAGSDYRGATGDVKVVSTSGATFKVTGVQLEKGSTATAYDYRPYGTELALCQRYYEKSYNNSIAIGTAITAGTGQLFVNAIGSGGTVIAVNFAVSKRASPTVVSYDNAGAAGKNSYYVSSWNNNGAATVNGALEKGFNITLSGTGTLIYLNADWSATAEL